MAINWHIEVRPIQNLREHPKNPRTLTKDQSAQLKQCITKFGLIDKPIVNTDNRIIGGHQRLKVLKKMGYKNIECWVPDCHLSERDIDELNIRLNKNTGSWDMDILANQWNLNDLLEWGFTEPELTGLEPDVEEIEPEELKTLAPHEDSLAFTSLGDIYELNGHRLVCGDSTLPEYVDKCLNGNVPILMVTDPPYGVNYDPSWRNGKSKHQGNLAIGVVQNDDQVNWSLAWYLFPGSVAYVWHSGKFACEVSQSLQDAEYKIISQIIWNKKTLVMSRGDYHWKHEPCWYAVRSGHKHNWQGARDQSTVWDIANLSPIGRTQQCEEERTAHSTQKPIECMARPIKNNTKSGEGVYDPFLGSGTTLIAAQQLDRICYAIELSPAYCDIAVQRWVTWMKNKNKDFTIKHNGIPIDWENKSTPQR